MDKNLLQEIANKYNLGPITFKDKTSIGNKNLMEIGYVWVDGYQELFCKRQAHQSDFYLCNQFNRLNL